MATLSERLADIDPSDPDELYAAYAEWVAARGLTPYPHQEEALLELVTGGNVILATPTGSGKSLVAAGLHFFSLARRIATQSPDPATRTTGASGASMLPFGGFSGGVPPRSYYTAPIKALVSEKFFDLCETFGAENVGMVTGDASVNADAPIICCTAEILANLALREGADLAVDSVVMDEFHFYAEPDRGWAWQVPLLELPHAQFLLMSATLGDVTMFRDDLTRRTGRPTAVVADAPRPVPLHFRWAMTPLHETLEDIVAARETPAYVVHFTQAAALERAQALMSLNVTTREEKAAITDMLGGFRFGKGFGQVLARLVKHGIGVHHAGMLPKYRRLVETLAQAGLLKVICGTDTLGVGINVPIRTVVLTSLSKYDGNRQRLLKAREFHQIAGRAGRAGYDVSGTVVVQAPDHVIENHRAMIKAGDDVRKQRKLAKRKPPEGFVNYSQDTFDRLVAAVPEPLTPRLRVTYAMVLNVIQRPGDPVWAMRRLLTDNHETPRSQAHLQRRAIQILRSLLQAGIVERLPEPDATGRTLAVVVDLQRNFSLNQPLSAFALAALDLLDPAAPTYALDVVSVIEATLDDPRAVLFAQQFKARGEAVAEMKADGLEYDERMELLEDVSWPKPLEELLAAAYATYRPGHPWLAEEDLSPKSVVRDLFERAMTFGEYVAFYQLQRAEGLVLRYLTDAYRALRQTVPDAAKTEELEDLIAWLGELVRQTDSSLLDEWEALTDPTRDEAAPVRPGDVMSTGPKPITANERAFRVLVRSAMWRRVELLALERFAALAELDAETAVLPAGGESADPLEAGEWAEAYGELAGDYPDNHGTDLVGIGPEARGPGLLRIDAQSEPGFWLVEQILDDPQGDHDWRIFAEVDLAASDEAGELVLRATDLARA